MAAVVPVPIDRADVHKSCKSLEGIISVLSNYTEAAGALAAAQKKLAKALKEAANIKGTNTIPASAMMNSAGVFDALAEVDFKFAKVADKEAENVGSELRKWFKKLAKEEKAHDERITNANARIRQAGQSYEKKAKRKDRDVSDEHTRYLAVLNSVGPEMSQDKYNHCLMVTQRHTLTLSGCAASLSRLAEAEWARACESVRRSAPCIGGVGEGRALCEAGWSGPVPNDLPDLNAHESERGMRNADPSEKVQETIKTLTRPSPSSNGHSDSPNSPQTTRTSLSTGRSSETNSAERPQPHLVRPPSPSSISEPANDLRKKPSDPAAIVSSLPQLIEAKEVLASSTSSVTVDSATGDSLSASLGNIRTLLPTVDEREAPGVEEDNSVNKAIKPDSKLSHPQLSQEPSLPPFTSRELPPRDRGQTRNGDAVSDHERDRKAAASSPVSPRTNSTTGAVALDRRLSMESMTSNASLVATMRGRYDAPVTKPASPPPRDLPRLTQSVTDLATRHTPVDSSMSTQRGLVAERFPTFQDRYPRSPREKDRDRDRYRNPAAAPALEREYFSERDAERRHYSPVNAERNKFIRDDHERYRPHSPDQFYADEMGVRDRPRRIDLVADERALREREERLRERERQLDIERARLRESGYMGDTSGQNLHNTLGVGRRNNSPGAALTHDVRRRNDSPEPISAQSLLPPPDHSPNCGCQRCSVQFYASSTPSLPRTAEIEPPIKLRPDKPKGWLRRMSLDVIAQTKSRDVGIASMALPEEDVRVRRRSFEADREKEAAMRFGGTTRR